MPSPQRYIKGNIGKQLAPIVEQWLKDRPQMSANQLIEAIGDLKGFSPNSVRGLIKEVRENLGIHYEHSKSHVEQRQMGESRKADPQVIFPELEEKPELIFDGFEEGEYTPRPPYILPTPCKILLLNDVHIPYHDRNALLAALQYGREQGIDTVYMNGDILDFYGVSRWSKNPDKGLLKREIQIAQNFFAGLRKMFPKQKLIYKSGNHENRFDRYIIDVAPGLFGIEGFDIPSILKLADYGIDYVDDKTIAIAGELNILHGHEVKFGGINVARSMYLKASTNVIFGHFHVSQEYTQRSLGGKLHGCWAIGCLCDLKPDYHPINNWNHGFAIITVNADGSFEVESKKIIDGKVL